MNKEELIDILKARGFSYPILEAFRKIKREDFISSSLEKHAYEDVALPLISNATISQPYTIAFMLDLLDLKKGLKVLEIGSGSGYVLALIENIIKSKVYGVEIIPELAESSQKLLKKNKNIIIISKSGRNGLPEHAPYDRILVSASADKVPASLISQLKDDGIIVSSVQDSIVKIKKFKDKIKTQEFPGFAFVPLVD